MPHARIITVLFVASEMTMRYAGLRVEVRTYERTGTMSHVSLALPGSALHRGFRGCSTRLNDFTGLGNLAIGTLPDKKGLFTFYEDLAVASGNNDCSTRPLSAEESVLDGAIVQFAPESEEEVPCPAGCNQFVATISRMTPSPNYAYAVRVQGLFSQLRISPLPYYHPAHEIPDSLIRRLCQIRGILLGFYFPPLLDDVAWSGYRFHFLSEDRTLTGRLLDCEIGNPQIALHHLDECRITLPKTSDFQLTDF